MFSDLQFIILGEEVVTWLVLNGFASTREDAVICGRDLMSLGLIKHVTDDQDFRDGFFFYRFVVSSEFTFKRQKDDTKLNRSVAKDSEDGSLESELRVFNGVLVHHSV